MWELIQTGLALVGAFGICALLILSGLVIVEASTINKKNKTR